VDGASDSEKVNQVADKNDDAYSSLERTNERETTRRDGFANDSILLMRQNTAQRRIDRARASDLLCERSQMLVSPPIIAAQNEHPLLVAVEYK